MTEEIKTPTPEEQAKKAKQEEMVKRIEAFNAELIPLLKKHKVGLGADPIFIRAENSAFGFTVAARPTIFDDTPREEPKAVPPPTEKPKEELIEA